MTATRTVPDPVRVEVRPEPVDGPVALRLLAALDAELDARYADADDLPPPVHRAADYAPPRGTFLVARVGDRPVGCGGLRPGPHPGTAEVKRMYVLPAERGRRVAERLLAALEQAAREAGYRALVLETGTAQPEAIRLYTRLGWRPVPPFGHYAGSPLVRSYGRELA